MLLLLLLLLTSSSVGVDGLLPQLVAHHVHLRGGRHLLHLLQLGHGHRGHAEACQARHVKVLRLHTLLPVKVAADVVLREGLHAEGLGQRLVLGVSLCAMVRGDVHLQALLGAVAAVAVLAAERLFRVGFVSAGEDVRLQVALGRGDVDALRTVPPFAAPSHLQQQAMTLNSKFLPKASHLDMREGVVLLPAAERVKFIAGAKKTLHHDRVRRCRRHIRRVLTEELEEPCRVGGGLGDIITLLPNPC